MQKTPAQEPDSLALPPAIASALDRLDELVGQFEQHPDASVRDAVLEMLRCVDVVHRAGLRRIVDAVRDSDRGAAALQAPEARLLLELYDMLGAVTPPAPGFVPLGSLVLPQPEQIAWRRALSAPEVPPGSIRAVEVEREWVLLANVEGKLHAYRNVCPGSPLPLHRGRLEGTVLHCPWHRCRFDLSSGRRLDGDEPDLTRLPLSTEGDEIRVGVSGGRAA